MLKMVGCKFHVFNASFVLKIVQSNEIRQETVVIAKFTPHKIMHMHSM